MRTVSIFWNDKRIKGKFYLCDLAPELLEILEQNKADKIEIKYPHNSIDTYKRQELLSITEQNRQPTAERLNSAK